MASACSGRVMAAMRVTVRNTAIGSVGARLDLERLSDTRRQAQAAGLQQREHRGGVGRADDRADQQADGHEKPNSHTASAPVNAAVMATRP